jgi:hypothetical protein
MGRTGDLVMAVDGVMRDFSLFMGYFIIDLD